MVRRNGDMLMFHDINKRFGDPEAITYSMNIPVDDVIDEYILNQVYDPIQLRRFKNMDNTDKDVFRMTEKGHVRFKDIDYAFYDGNGDPFLYLYLDGPITDTPEGYAETIKRYFIDICVMTRHNALFGS